MLPFSIVTTATTFSTPSMLSQRAMPPLKWWFWKKLFCCIFTMRVLLALIFMFAFDGILLPSLHQITAILIFISHGFSLHNHCASYHTRLNVMCDGFSISIITINCDVQLVAIGFFKPARLSTIHWSIRSISLILCSLQNMHGKSIFESKPPLLFPRILNKQWLTYLNSIFWLKFKKNQRSVHKRWTKFSAQYEKVGNSSYR